MWWETGDTSSSAPKPPTLELVLPLQEPAVTVSDLGRANQYQVQLGWATSGFQDWHVPPGRREGGECGLGRLWGTPWVKEGKKENQISAPTS